MDKVEEISTINDVIKISLMKLHLQTTSIFVGLRGKHANQSPLKNSGKTKNRKEMNWLLRLPKVS